jgi:hypothetical protein
VAHPALVGRAAMLTNRVGIDIQSSESKEINSFSQQHSFALPNFNNMAGFLRGKQAGIQNDLSASILPGLFAPDDQARYGINSQIG